MAGKESTPREWLARAVETYGDGTTDTTDALVWSVATSLANIADSQVKQVELSQALLAAIEKTIQVVARPTAEAPGSDERYPAEWADRDGCVWERRAGTLYRLVGANSQEHYELSYLRERFG